MKKNGNGEKEILWIVRYENGDIGCLYGTRQALRSTHKREAEKKGPDISLSEIGQSEQKEEIGNTIPSRSPTAQGG